MSYPWHLYLMAVLYIGAGCMHFIKPKAYLRIMPRFLPRHKQLVYVSGAAEILLGIGVCIPAFKNFSIYALILMLLIFLLVHFYMLSGKKEAAGFPRWLLLIRVPLQFILIYWAWWYLQY